MMRSINTEGRTDEEVIIMLFKCVATSGSAAD